MLPLKYSLLILLASNIAFAKPILRPSSWAVKIIKSDIENFHKVSDTLYRSAQPKKEALVEYKEFGIKTILNLRAFHSDKELIDDINITLVEAPLNLLKLKEEDIFKALKSYHKAKKPVAVHCQHGSDRTGLIVAIYRVIYENWSKKEAIDELVNGDYGYHSIFKNVIEFIENMDVEKFKKLLKQ